MSFLDNLFGRPAHHASAEQHARRERRAFNAHREAVLDELETAVVDSTGKRFKEREIRTAMKTVSRL